MDVFEFHKKLHETLKVLRAHGIERITEDNLELVKMVLEENSKVDASVREVIRNLDRKKKRYTYNAILDFLKRRVGAERFDKKAVKKLKEYMENKRYSDIANEIQKELGMKPSKNAIRVIYKLILGDLYPISRYHPNVTLKSNKIIFPVLSVLQEIPPGELEKIWSKKHVEMSMLGEKGFEKAIEQKKAHTTYVERPSLKYMHRNPEREKLVKLFPCGGARSAARRTIELNEEIEKACRILGLNPDAFLVDKITWTSLEREKAFARVLIEAGPDKADLLIQRGVDKRLVKKALEFIERASTI